MLEIVTFALHAGADVEAFLAADARLQTDWAYRQRGLVRRTTARGDDGRWAVVTVWADREAVEAAARTAATDKVVSAFDAFIDPSTRHAEVFEGLPG